jgi:hypothetical protein
MTSGTTAALYGVSGASTTTVTAVGDTGKTLSYANVGTAWTTQAPAPRNLRGVWAADSAHVYAVGVAAPAGHTTGRSGTSSGPASRRIS